MTDSPPVFPLDLRFLGPVNLSYQSTGSVLTLVMKTDGAIQAEGFNATYTKRYAGTDLIGMCGQPHPNSLNNKDTKSWCIVRPSTPLRNTVLSLSLSVPDPPTPLPTVRVPNPSLPPAESRMFLKHQSRTVRTLVEDWEAEGYSTRWVGPYRETQSTRVFYDVVFHNSTALDTRAAVELSPARLLNTIAALRLEGYSVWGITDRVRNRAPYPIYSALFGRTPPIYKTEVFIRDNITTYLRRLNDMKRRHFQLVSHSMEQPANMALEATSVWIQDRRIDFNISVEKEPLQWRSYYNLTFLQFTEVTLDLGAEDADPQFYPKFVDVYTPQDSSDSRFVSLYEEVTESTKVMKCGSYDALQ